MAVLKYLLTTGSLGLQIPEKQEESAYTKTAQQAFLRRISELKEDEMKVNPTCRNLDEKRILAEKCFLVQE